MKTCKNCDKPVGLRNGIPRTFCSMACSLEFRKRTFKIPPRNTLAENYITNHKAI